MKRLLLLLALVTGILLPVAGASGAPASAADRDLTGIGVRLVDAPVATRDDPRARVYIIDHVAPGTVVERRIEVSNDSGQRARVAVYAAAADIVRGAFVGSEADTQNDLSSWTSMSTPEVTLEQGSSEMVDVTIDVPEDAAPGEQYAVLWAQTTAGAEDGGGVTQVSRVGIRVYLSVGPGGEPASDFEVESLTPSRDADGLPVLEATVHNTGGRALDLSGELRLSEGPGGLSVGPVPVALGTTLGVGETAPIRMQLDEALPDGPWKARVSVTSGLLTRDAQATVTFPESGTGESVPAESTPVWWFVAGGLLLVALLVLGSRLVLRARRTAGTVPGTAPGTTPHPVDL